MTRRANSHAHRVQRIGRDQPAESHGRQLTRRLELDHLGGRDGMRRDDEQIGRRDGPRRRADERFGSGDPGQDRAEEVHVPPDERRRLERQSIDDRHDRLETWPVRRRRPADEVLEQPDARLPSLAELDRIPLLHDRLDELRQIAPQLDARARRRVDAVDVADEHE